MYCKFFVHFQVQILLLSYNCIHLNCNHLVGCHRHAWPLASLTCAEPLLQTQPRKCGYLKQIGWKFTLAVYMYTVYI